MFQNTDAWSWSRGRARQVERAILIGALAVALAAALSLGSAARCDEPPAADAGSKERKERDALKKPPAFDLSCFEPGREGLWAIRPAAAFADPQLKALGAQLDQAANDWLHAKGVPAEVRVSLADVEQVSGGLIFRGEQLDAPFEKRRFQATLDRVQLSKPYSWATLLTPLSPEAAESAYRGVRVYEWSEPPIPLLDAAKSTAAADDRTLLPFWSRERIDRWLARRAKKDGNAPDAALLSCWREVETCTAAVLFDNRHGDWDEVEDPEPLGNEVLSAWGVEFREGEIYLRFIDDCKTEESARELRLTMEDLNAAEARLEREAAARPDLPAAEREQLLLRVPFYENARVEQQGRRVRVLMHGRYPLDVKLKDVLAIAADVLRGVDVNKYLSLP